MAVADSFCLRWNDFESNISTSFRELRENEEFFDVTLCCDNGTDVVQAHKVILAACSPLFRRILSNNRHQNTFLYLKGIQKKDLLLTLAFIYNGQVNVAQDELNGFLSVAEELAIKGLTSHETSGSDVRSTQKRISASAKRRHTSRHVSPCATAKRRAEPAVEIGEDGDSLDFKQRIKSEESPIDRINDNDVDDENGVAKEGNDEFDHYAPFSDDYDESGLGTPGGSGLTAGGESRDVSQVEDLIIRDTAEGLYFCSACGHKSGSRKDLIRHIESRHASITYSCDLCLTEFNTKRNLQRHNKRYHDLNGPAGDIFKQRRKKKLGNF